MASLFADRSADQSPQALCREKTKLSDPTLARALIEMFIERLIGEFSPTTPFNCGGTLRLRQAAEMRVFSPILCNAFEAASLTFTGNRQQNRSIEMAGHARYIRVLGQLQKAVYNPQRSQSTDVLTVVLLSTIIEVSSLWRDLLGFLRLTLSTRPLNKVPRTPFLNTNWEVSICYGHGRPIGIDMALNGLFLSTCDSTG